MAEQLDIWTESCTCCDYSAQFTKYDCGCITRQNTDKWKEPCSKCDTFTEEASCGNPNRDRYSHKSPAEQREIERQRQQNREREDWERKEREERGREEKEREIINKYKRPSQYVPDTSWQTSLVKIAAGIAAILLVIWLVFQVILPLVIINAALILLVLSFIIRKWQAKLQTGAILGAVITSIDFYTQAGFNSSLIRNISFPGNGIIFLLCLNVATGIAAAILLVYNHQKQQ